MRRTRQQRSASVSRGRVLPWPAQAKPGETNAEDEYGGFRQTNPLCCRRHRDIVGIVVGAGIFETPPLVASNTGSAFATIAVWVLGGVLSLLGALCYAELATTYPDSGGIYYYIRRAFGELLHSCWAGPA